MSSSSDYQGFNTFAGVTLWSIAAAFLLFVFCCGWWFATARFRYRQSRVLSQQGPIVV